MLLQAMKRLVERGVDVQLSIHGANLELQPQDFLDEFDSLLEAIEEHVTFAGPYSAEDLPGPAGKRPISWLCRRSGGRTPRS